MAQSNVSKNDTKEMQRSEPAPFLIKTYQIVDDSATDDIISWNECGSAFVVWRPPEFSRDLLPNHFKHNNFSSFVRQLNTYGFKKTVSNRWEFANDFFKKGERHLLLDIHRRKTLYVASDRSLPLKRPLSPTRSVEEQAASSGSSARVASAAYSDESEKLKTENMLLAAEVSCLRSLCMDLFLHIQSHSMISAENLGHINRLFSRLPNRRITLDNCKFSEQALGQKIEVESNKQKAHDHKHVQSGNLLAICDASLGTRPNGPPKLFGVPLPGRGLRFLEPILEHGRQ